jgi:hypothetical protein
VFLARFFKGYVRIDSGIPDGKYYYPFTGNGLRKTLVIIQFASSIFLVIATLGIGYQIRYVREK